jgi:hypothetical protein
VIASFLLSVCLVQSTPVPAIDLKQARDQFALVQKLWDADGGKLWGMPLNGPMIFVDPRSRTAVANAPDQEGHLKAQEGVFTGTLPAGIPIANFSMKWAGVTWIMVIWPLPSDAQDRAVLLMHEPFHRVQAQLGLPPTNPSNPHLDTADGRYWLQLEWRALRAALRAEGEARNQAIKDALVFRAIRRNIFPEARVEERSLEMHEGLANYTGVALSGMTLQEQRDHLIERLESQAKMFSTFTRSFAYLSGPAYGVLLDLKSVPWRTGLKPENDFGTLVQTYYGLAEPNPTKSEAEEIAKKYDDGSLRQGEDEREKKRQERISRYRKQFIDEPVLIVPMIKAQRQFNPSNLQPIDNLGTVYPTLQVIDVWGTVNVKQGALLSKDYKTLTLSAPKDTHAKPIVGDGWELELKEGWELKPGKRTGDWELVKVK